MELKRTVVANTQYLGQQAFDISAGQSIKVETTPNGLDILDEECPAGHEWHVEVSVHVTEHAV